jgi:hypothetical protein
MAGALQRRVPPRPAKASVADVIAHHLVRIGLFG